nr:hypothetical protein HUO10_000323 [Paraburkholderia busanensis]
MNVPDEIGLDARAMTLRWPDGSVQRIAYGMLRDACPCAGCRRQRGDAGTFRLARSASANAGIDTDADTGTKANTAAAIRVTEIRPMGYGAQLIFSDGHDRGIFPWPYFSALPDVTDEDAGEDADNTDNLPPAATHDALTPRTHPRPAPPATTSRPARD